MAIKAYRQDEKVYWKVYVHLCSKTNPLLRKQKTKTGIESQAAARRMEKQIIAELSSELALECNQGFSWLKVIERWEKDAFAGVLKKYEPTTITDTVAGLKKWTGEWLLIPAEELTRANGRDAQKKMHEAGLSIKAQKKIKSMVNTVFNYALDEKLILKQIPSPMISVIFEKGDEKVPDILNLTEMKLLLSKAREYDNQWYPVWATALLTGMRNGELYALEWTDVDFENLQIKVSRSYDIRTDRFKSTKAGYWRTVPISSDLLQLLKELKVNLKFREASES